MLQEGLQMSAGNSHIQEEMREVEEEIEEDSSAHDPHNRGRSIPLESLEEGKAEVPPSPRRGISSPIARSSSPRGPTISFPLSSPREKKGGAAKSLKERARGMIQLFTSPVFAQAFILTFLGEWGDRSQITTIAMAGAHVSVDLVFEVAMTGRRTLTTAERPGHCLWDNFGTWAVYLHGGHGGTLFVHEDICQTQ
jgi:putative Ca2+/H+ antiporter (TMEM165/GDT1 family)